MQRYSRLEQQIEDTIKMSWLATDPVHSRSTREWVLKLKPDADYALQVAALAHDIERGVSSEDEVKYREITGDYSEQKVLHSKKSAEVTRYLLIDNDFNESFVSRVEQLILNHEIGGDPDSDVLKDADSLSFFQDNLSLYFKIYGESSTRFKIGYMYGRMSDDAKGFVKRFSYDNPLLESIFKETISLDDH